MGIEDETPLEPEAGSSRDEAVGVKKNTVSFSLLYFLNLLFAVALRREDPPLAPPIKEDRNKFN